MKQELFSTPVWTFEAPDCILLNAGLLSIADQFTNYTNYFDIEHQSVKTLESFIISKCKDILIENNIKATSIKGKQTALYYGQADTPHAHALSRLVAVYYVLVPQDSSAILLHDPRGFIDLWSSGPDRGRPYHRIMPYPGMLLVFPGYLIHSVETNLSRDPRLCIVCNIE